MFFQILFTMSLLLLILIYRNSHQRVFFRKGALQNFTTSKKTPFASESNFNKVAGLQSNSYSDTNRLFYRIPLSDWMYSEYIFTNIFLLHSLYSSLKNMLTNSFTRIFECRLTSMFSQIKPEISKRKNEITSFQGFPLIFLFFIFLMKL